MRFPRLRGSFSVGAKQVRLEGDRAAQLQGQTRWQWPHSRLNPRWKRTHLWHHVRWWERREWRIGHDL